MSGEPDENEEHIDILKTDSIFDFNFVKPLPIEGTPQEDQLTQVEGNDIFEASQAGATEVQVEELEEKQEQSKKSEIDAQAREVSKEVLNERGLSPIGEEDETTTSEEDEPITTEEAKEEVPVETTRSKRSAKPSFKITDNLIQEELKAKAARERENQKKSKSQLAQLQYTDTDQDISTSEDGGPTDSSITSIAKRFITPNLRLETYNPTSQATVIYGEQLKDLTKPDSLCSLCGFQLKDRISYWHNKIHNPDNLETLTWSYDHFVPVNFSAVVFRIPTSKSNHNDKEKEYLKNIGHIACYHCNYEKSQRMFITCPVKNKVKDFQNFTPNTDSIRIFVHDLYKSQNKNGWSKEGDAIKRTLTKCLTTEKKHYATWIRERIQAITTLAENICNILKNQIDVRSVNKRYRLTQVLISKADTLLKENSEYKDLKPNSKKIRYRKAYIAKLFAATEEKFPKPWKDYTLVSTDEQERRAGSRRRLKKKSKRNKTYRRKRLF
jgi:hypothetical protein